MNRVEKNVQTRQKIIDSALHEFGEKHYSDASLNTICSAGGISKGIIYHYFKDKDELYLICIKECFDLLTNYLYKTVEVKNVSLENALTGYFNARLAFFAEHPLYLGIFCSAIINPPVHLSAVIDKLTADFHSQSVSFLRKMLDTVKLRQGISVEEVTDVFCEYQDFVHTRFQMKTMGEVTLREHEQRCRRSLQIMLYGIIERTVE